MKFVESIQKDFKNTVQITKICDIYLLSVEINLKRILWKSNKNKHEDLHVRIYW